MVWSYYTVNHPDSIRILAQNEIPIEDYIQTSPYFVKRSNQDAAMDCFGTGVGYAFTPEELSRFLFMLSLVEDSSKEEYALELIEQIWLERPENKED